MRLLLADCVQTHATMSTCSWISSIRQSTLQILDICISTHICQHPLDHGKSKKKKKKFNDYLKGKKSVKMDLQITSNES